MKNIFIFRHPYATVISSILVALIFFTFTLGQTLEEIFFPVTEIGVIEEVNSTSLYSSSLSFSTIMNRPGCELLETKWFLGEYLGRATFIQSDFNADDVSINSNGITWNNLVVHLPYEWIISNSYAITYHRCHPFWVSRSVIYNSS